MTDGHRFTVVDCFAGAGGLSLGLQMSGLEVVEAFDSDQASADTYRRNIGEHILVECAENLTGSRLLQAAGISTCDVVAGGPPCQGFSRQRRGSDDDGRNDLVFEFLRLVLEIAPTMFVMENVSAIAGPRGRVYLAEFTRRALLAGYRLHSKILDAADYGVPQRRKRFILVGEIDNGVDYFEFPPPIRDRRTVRDAIGDLPAPGSPAGMRIANHEPDNISEINRLRISYVPPGGGREYIPEHLRLPCHRVSVDRAGHRNVYGRLHWDEPAATITTKCNSFTRGKFAHPDENRNITMREAARLQSFPDDFVFVGDKVAVAHQIGNAVPPELARYLGHSIVDALARRERGEPLKLSSTQLTLNLVD